MIWIVIIVALIFDIFLAAEFGSIAERKGYSAAKYFWIVFFLGIFGMLWVAALPDLNVAGILKTLQQSGGNTKQEDNEPPIHTLEGQWKCSKCGAVNENYVYTCACGQKKQDN